MRFERNSDRRQAGDAIGPPNVVAFGPGSYRDRLSHGQTAQSKGTISGCSRFAFGELHAHGGPSHWPLGVLNHTGQHTRREHRFGCRRYRSWYPDCLFLHHDIGIIPPLPLHQLLEGPAVDEPRLDGDWPLGRRSEGVPAGVRGQGRNARIAHDADGSPVGPCG